MMIVKPTVQYDAVYLVLKNGEDLIARDVYQVNQLDKVWVVVDSVDKKMVLPANEVYYMEMIKKEYI